MKKYKVEELEFEKTRVIKIENVFKSIKGENEKNEDKLLGFKIFVEMIENFFTKKLNHSNTLMTNKEIFKKRLELELKSNFYLLEKERTKDTEYLVFYKLYKYETKDYYSNLKKYYFLNLIRVQNLKEGMFFIPVFNTFEKENFSSLEKREIKTEVYVDKRFSYENLVKLLASYDFKIFDKNELEIISDEIYENLKDEIIETKNIPRYLQTFENIEKDIQLEKENESDLKEKTFSLLSIIKEL